MTIEVDSNTIKDTWKMAEETRVEKLPELASPEPETKTSAQFDRAAKDWETNPLAPRAAEKAVTDFLSTVPLTAESTVIELGCGSGLCTELIARKVRASIAVMAQLCEQFSMLMLSLCS